MDLSIVLMLAGAGLAGGIITAIVGGSSLITFPALLAAGLPPVLASSSSTVALTPSNLAAAIADRESIPRWNRSFAGLIVVSVIGSVSGAVLLLNTSNAAFTSMVPVLIGGATLLFAFSDHIKRWAAARSNVIADGGRAGDLARLALYVPVAVYGGYFGAAMGVMLLGILSLGHEVNFRAINAVKNILASLVSVVALVIFVWQGSVAWPPALAIMAGALVGGFMGGRLVRVLPTGVLRGIVIVVGGGLAVVYAFRYWRL